jgi:hypothetical protein
LDNKKKYKLEDLLKNCNDENSHEEIITDVQGKEFPNRENIKIDNAGEKI